jgi:D-alanyl-lipoteichoic acid acyltransferase DltB (MBOAT superfamily)
LSVIISIILISASLLFDNRPVTIGLLIGAVVSITSFTSVWWTIGLVFKKKENQNPLLTVLAILVYVVKLPVIGIALYFAFQYLKINLLALIAGLTVMLMAIVVIGISNLVFKRRALT